jgi:hypothetical protein
MRPPVDLSPQVKIGIDNGEQELQSSNMGSFNAGQAYGFEPG